VYLKLVENLCCSQEIHCPELVTVYRLVIEMTQQSNTIHNLCRYFQFWFDKEKIVLVRCYVFYHTISMSMSQQYLFFIDPSLPLL
jgi:hypothetical protein